MTASDVTILLDQMNKGDADARRHLIDAVYDELRSMAADKMRSERANHTLQPTALVNEACMRLLGSTNTLQSRAHFFGAAAKAMERVLIDHARMKNAAKRGAGAVPVTLLDVGASIEDGALDLLELQDALANLEEVESDLANLVRMRYFAGLTLEQIAEINETSLATTKRHWTFARAWLYDKLKSAPDVT